MNSINTMTEKEKKESIQLVDSIMNRYTTEIQLWKSSLSDAIIENKWNKEIYQSMDVFMKIRLAILDITISFKYILKAESEVEQNLFTRLMCSQLYEFINDLPIKIVGKRFRKTMSQLPQKNEELIKELNRVMKILNSNGTRFLKDFYSIRNNVAFHKDIDGMNQIKLIEELDFDKIITGFLKINDWFTEWSGFESMLIKITEKDYK
jgi:hypothetical protein